MDSKTAKWAYCSRRSRKNITKNGKWKRNHGLWFGKDRCRSTCDRQVIHFDYPEERPLERMRFALDTQSPEDIAVRQVEIVSEDFHARYLVKEKTYQFRVDIGKPRSPFRRHYASYFPYPLDLEKIQRALPDLLGTHDFTSFCASGSSIEDKIRTIYEAKMEVNETKDELLFTFRGNGFLYKMIRILVGTLLKIGNGRLPEDSIPDIIAKKIVMQQDLQHTLKDFICMK